LWTPFSSAPKKLEGCKGAKVQQDESYLSTGNLASLNTFCHTGFAPDTYRVPDSYVSTGARSVSRPRKSVNILDILKRVIVKVEIEVPESHYQPQSGNSLWFMSRENKTRGEYQREFHIIYNEGLILILWRG
jgi:hypothetical protein